MNVKSNIYITMKSKHTLTALLLAVTLFPGCDNDSDEMLSEIQNNQFPNASVMAFAPDDGAISLTGSPAYKVSRMLSKLNPEIAKGFGEIPITPEEYDEIKVFTDSLVQGCTTEEKKYKTIFNWVHKNIKYAYEDEQGNIISNDPYPVFKNRKAICQGYANLQHIMSESQNILTLNVNGDYVGIGGHAWNYVYYNKKWYVSDPTNNGSFSMSQTSKYRHLAPFSIDAKLFENDEYVCNYKDCEINIDEIKTEKSQFTVPFGMAGFKVTSVSPTKPVPTCVKEIFISKNVVTLGEYYKGLQKNAPSIERAYVQDGNRKLESYKGAVYKINGGDYQLCYVPGSLRSFELKPMKFLDKNTVLMHDYLEEVVIPAGTQEVSAYAFEKCPKLRVAYIPENTKVDEKAFWEVHPDFQIIRGDYTGIPEITL